uniref:Uncharacterized protein n=1 Tax=Arundo donax TaxID=35708 RepID=A0A0A9GAJ5_ARUDO
MKIAHVFNLISRRVIEYSRERDYALTLCGPMMVPVHDRM